MYFFLVILMKPCAFIVYSFCFPFVFGSNRCAKPPLLTLGDQKNLPTASEAPPFRPYAFRLGSAKGSSGAAQRAGLNGLGVFGSHQTINRTHDMEITKKPLKDAKRTSVLQAVIETSHKPPFKKPIIINLS